MNQTFHECCEQLLISEACLGSCQKSTMELFWRKQLKAQGHLTISQKAPS